MTVLFVKSAKLAIVVSIGVMAAILVLGVMPATATTYYVNWETGDDANDGLAPEMAWKSLTRGESSILAPGDTVEVAAGTYKPGANPYWFYMGGIAGNPITYHANGRVIVDGEYLQGYTPIMLNGTADYRVFDGFEVIHGKKGAIYSNYCAGVTIKNCTFRDIGQLGAGNVYVVWNENNGGGWRYQNNLFYNVTTDAAYAGGIYTYGVSTPANEIYNNTFHNIGPNAVVHTSGTVDFKNNIVSEAIGNSYPAYGGTVTHSYNLFYNNAYNPTLDVGETVEDPQYVSVAAGNFRVKSTSPAIDTGIDVGLSMIDGDGDGTAEADRGAYEYDPSAAPGTAGGTVSDNLGNLMSGVLVEAVGEGISITTASDGAYSLSLAAGGHLIRASKTGFFSEEAIVEVPGGGNVTQNFVLSGPARVEGKVLQNKAGNPPLPGAKVKVTSPSMEVTTDAEGNYAIDLPSGTRHFQISYLGFETIEEDVALSTGTTAKDWLVNQVPPNDWYVKPAELGGSDSNGGTGWEDAFATIDKADHSSLLGPGDTVFIWPGVYPLNPQGYTVLINKCAGTPVAPITYKAWTDTADPAARPVIGNGNSAGAYVDKAWIVIDGLEVTDSLDGITVGGGGANLTVKNCVIHGLWTNGYWSRGLNIWGANCTAINNLFYDITDLSNPSSEQVAAVQPSGGAATIYNNTIVGTTNGVFGGGSNVLVVNNIIADMSHYGVLDASITGSYNLFWNNTAGDYKSGSGPYRVGDFKANPMLDSEYKPQAGSPAINTGVDVGFDLNGSAPGNFNGPRPDRGWFETEFETLGAGSVVGQVYDAVMGTTVVGATVTAGTATATSDANGYLLYPIAAGTHSMTVSASGYATTTGSVMVAAGEGVAKDFYLVPSGAMTVSTIGELRELGEPLPFLEDWSYSNAIPVVLTGQKVIVLPVGWSYIAEADRSAGIMALPYGAWDVSEGDRVTVAGRVARDGNDELFFWVGSVMSQTTGEPLQPVGMNNKAAATAEGHLATIWGNITGSGAGYIYVDDGSGLNDGLGLGTGIRVELGGLTAPTSGYVSVTGVIGKSWTSNVLVVKPRGADDIH